MKIPFTEKNLKDWAGWRAYRDGKSLFTRGVVEKVTIDASVVTGVLNLGPRGMRSRFEILKNGLVENHCPCRDNQERGLICSHLVALGLETIRQHSHPVSSHKDGEASTERRAERRSVTVVEPRIRRGKHSEPGAIQGSAVVALSEDWLKQTELGHVVVHIFIDYDGKRVPVGEVDKSLLFYFSKVDEEILCALEDIAGGSARNELKLSIEVFLKILKLHHGQFLHQQNSKEKIRIHNGSLNSVMLMDLDRQSGEILLSVGTDGIPEADLFRSPKYIVGEEDAWVFCDNQFWKLSEILPKALRSIYRSRVAIPRVEVPAFLMTDLPQIEKYITVRSDITPDLFFMKPTKPSYSLVVKGSPASLAATLYAHYTDEVVLVAGRADMRGNFSIPDPRDLLKYRIRNMAAEKTAVQRLELVGLVGRAGDTLRNIVGPHEVLNFLGSGVPQIRRWGWTVEMEGRVKPFVESTEIVKPVIHVNPSAESTNYFDVSYDYEVGEGSITEMDIKRALSQGHSFIEKKGKTILLDADAIQQAYEIFEDCAVGAGDEHGSYRMRSTHSSYIEASLSRLEGVELDAESSWLEKAKKQNEQITVDPVELHPKLTGTLRSYQQEGVNWLRFLEKRGFCGILADEMGLGKTLQTLAWIQLERVEEEARNKPALIVCPTSLVDNWTEEAAKFTPNLNVLQMHGTQRQRRWKKVAEADIVITSYALMRRDIEKHLDFKYSVVILDEAQHIKNHTTQNALSAKQLQADQRLVLTGTPVENSVSDLWSIMDFLMPGYLGDHKNFREFFELPILNGGQDGEYMQAKLRRKLHPFLLRRMKKHVAKDLPPKIERIAPCKLTVDQHKVYRELLEESRARITNMVEEEGFNKSRMEILKTLLRLRQTCCHIDLLKLDGVKSRQPSAKMELFFELLAEALDSKHRVLIFSQFTSMLAILRKEMDERKLKYCYLDGSTKDRQDEVRKFNSDHSIPAFLMSLKAGGTGLNLTGADMVIHFDPWWNPAVEDQATDRAHRIGQKRTVYSVKLISKGTVEEKVLEMQKRKKHIIDATLTTDEQVMQKLTWEDVQELLSL